jgi:PII-like signaling protein
LREIFYPHKYFSSAPSPGVVDGRDAQPDHLWIKIFGSDDHPVLRGIVRSMVDAFTLIVYAQFMFALAASVGQHFRDGKDDVGLLARFWSTLMNPDNIFGAGALKALVALVVGLCHRGVGGFYGGLGYVKTVADSRVARVSAEVGSVVQVVKSVVREVESVAKDLESAAKDGITTASVAVSTALSDQV